METLPIALRDRILAKTWNIQDDPNKVPIPDFHMVQFFGQFDSRVRLIRNARIQGSLEDNDGPLSNNQSSKKMSSDRMCNVIDAHLTYIESLKSETCS